MPQDCFPIRLGLASLNQTPLDWEGNRRRAEAALADARTQGASLLCLPELALSGYGCEDMFLAAYVRKQALESLIQLAPATGGMVVVVGLPLEVEGETYNAMALLADGVIAGFTCKQFLADDGIHYEPRWFRPWPAGKVSSVRVDGRPLPVGDLCYAWGSLRLGIEVCRDAWVEERPAKSLRARGVRLVLNPSASHFSFGKQTIRRRLACEGSALVEGVAAYVNVLGNESGRSIYDGASLVASQGELLAEGERFSYADHTLTVVPVEVPVADNMATESLVQLAVALPKTVVVDVPLPTIPTLDKHEVFAHAVPLGLFDYLRKSGSRGFVVSLSGGADSAAVVVLVWLMVRRAIQELGPKRFAERLGLFAVPPDADEAVHALLRTLYQATSSSSETTHAAASAVAEAIGAEHSAWEIDSLVQAYTEQVEQTIGRKLSWKEDDLALQNIQARVRAPGVWMLANLHRALLLTTGNRSEASVGYLTMDGDTAGGLAPIAGVDKAFLRDWLRWMEIEGPEGIAPLPALAQINAQQPTAELRPGDKQTDEADLMPYDVLDAIERSAIGDLDAPEQTLALLVEQFPQHGKEPLAAWLQKFWRLWKTSQWKRERLAPSFHLDTLSVDPKTWRRYPILSHVE